MSLVESWSLNQTTTVEVAHPGVQGVPGAVSSVNGRTGAVMLTSADVGLSNVDNTADASKPVSTAQAAADAAVANAAASALAAHVAAADPHTGYALESALGTAAALNVSTDGTLAANSDALVPSQKAVKTYADQLLAAADALVFKAVIDCSANPNYPAADKGWTYRVSVAGKIGGASGINVEVGDLLLCLADGTASGNHATVGANWSIAQTNIDGAVIGPASAVDGRVAMFDGTSGKLIKDSGLTLAGNNTGDETGARIATLLHASSAKTTLVDADEVNGTDSAASFGLIPTTWANVRAYLLNYFAPKGAATSSGLTMSTARLLGRTTAATGAVEEITPGANLSLVAGSLAVTPSGTSKQIQYNIAGTLGGVPQLEFDAATNELRLGVGLTYNNNTGTLTLRQKPGGTANLFEVRDSSDELTLYLNNDGAHLAPHFLDPVASLRTAGYIENSGRYVDSALGYSSGGTGDVLIISTASPAESKKATVTEREKIPVGVGAFANAPYWSTYRGKETVNADSGAIAIGDRLVMSATTDGFVCADTTNNIALATVGYALSAKAGGSPGTITAWVHPTPGYKTLTAESLTTVGVVKQTVYTVATLPSASASGNGARAHVSDALSPTFGATVAAGGSVSTPVYSDGTNWKVG